MILRLATVKGPQLCVCVCVYSFLVTRAQKMSLIKKDVSSIQHLKLTKTETLLIKHSKLLSMKKSCSDLC